MNLQHRVAVLTGAGGGIGRATAQALARRGCHIALVDVDPEGLRQTAALVALSGVRVSEHVIDIASRAQVAELPALVMAAHGQVDILINNAGVALGGTFEQTSEADFDWLMEINFHGVVRMTRAFLPLLRERDAARIVNVSSLFGLVSPPGQTAYSASKFAVRGFSNALRHELEGSVVGVTVVHPGGIATSIARNARLPASAVSITASDMEKRVRQAEKMLRMPAEKAGEILVKGIERERPRVLVGLDAKIVALLERLMPVHYWRLLGRGMS